MATRVRETTAVPTQRRPGNELPTYEKPKYPLNAAAQRELAQLHHARALTELDESYQEAQGALSVAAAEINDRLTEKDKAVKKRINDNLDSSQNGNVDEMVHRLDSLRDQVERMTERMEQSMRKIIDGRHSVKHMKDSIAHTAGDARDNASTQASTQNFRSQKRRRRKTDGDEDDDDASASDDEEYQDFEPTDPAAGSQRPSAIEVFRSKREDADTRYKAYTLTSRYAENNDYREFRKVVHDAKYPDGDVPLAHHSEWFKEDGPPAAGVTTRGRANADEEDDDDDIAVSKAKVSTKCPLTLQEFQSPLTSKKCPHSFEAQAILDMISTSQNRIEGSRNGERYVQCPVSGCSQRLTKDDLQVDNVLVRQIKRIQRAKELEDEEMEGEAGGDGGIKQTPTVIEDGDGDGADVDDIVEGRVIPQTQMKAESRASRTPAPRASAPPKSTAGVVDLESSPDEGEGEGESWDGDDDEDTMVE